MIRGEIGTAPPLDKRLEQFVRRYLDSPLKLGLLRCLAQRPNWSRKRSGIHRRERKRQPRAPNLMQGEGVRNG